MTARAPVLIAGAGPTGLLLAVWLNRYGVPFRIVDKADAPGLASRAIVLQARTLELYRSLGILDDVLAEGVRFERVCINWGGNPYGYLFVGKAGQGVSPLPFVLSYTQDEHEQLLERLLAARGVTVERGVEVAGVDAAAAGEPDRDAIVTLRKKDGTTETLTASYVVGCDGAHSGVRHAVGIKMEGGTYARAFFVADVYCSPSNMEVPGRLNICASRDDFMIILPLPHREGRARLIGFVPEGLEDKEGLTLDDCRPSMEACAPQIQVKEVRWFAKYRIHHRAADRFQYGARIFLCGDSAHLHSPVGGQGMNTGLGDASNLAWKLATAWHAGSAASSFSIAQADALLATYEAERQPFARLLVETTDQVFTFIIQKSFKGYLLRNYIVPYVLPTVARLFNLGRMLFARVSQTGVSYPNSPLSESAGGRSATSGLRLPWVRNAGGPANTRRATEDAKRKLRGAEAAAAAGAGTGFDAPDDRGADNHAVLDAGGWQAHLFTAHPQADHIPNLQERLWRQDVEEVLKEHRVPLMTFPWDKEPETAGFARETVYMVRPDGYVGLVLSAGAGKESKKILGEYITKWGVSALSSM